MSEDISRRFQHLGVSPGLTKRVDPLRPCLNSPRTEPGSVTNEVSQGTFRGSVRQSRTRCPGSRRGSVAPGGRSSPRASSALGSRRGLGGSPLSLVCKEAGVAHVGCTVASPGGSPRLTAQEASSPQPALQAFGTRGSQRQPSGLVSWRSGRFTGCSLTCPHGPFAGGSVHQDSGGEAEYNLGLCLGFRSEGATAQLGGPGKAV